MSLIESIGSLITPQLLGSLASRLGESEGAVQKGLQGGAATLLSGLAGKATDSGFLGQILGMLSSGSSSANLLGSLSSLASGETNTAVSDMGSKFLGMILGGGQGAITEAIGRAAGLKSGSAASLLSMAAPMVMGLLSQKVSQGGLNAGSLGKMLAGEASSLQGLLPAGIGSLLGGGLPKMAASIPEVSSGSPSWLLPVLIGAGLIAGLIWYMNQGTPPVQEAVKQVQETAKTAETAVANTANSLWAALGELFKRKLPNGVEISIPKLGVENRLLDFIEDGTKAVDKTTWFDFDRLLFDTGKATLQAVSQEQLDSVAQILKAFPNVEVKIGGYTDNTGDKAANMALSASRAASVKTELVKLGIDTKRVSSEGYGEQFPVGDNTTEEGRQKNRRVSMRITKK